MRSTCIAKWATLGLAILVGSCGLAGSRFTNPPVETRFSFVNFSRTAYATIGVRDSTAAGSEFTMVPLLAPGAIFRADFQDLVGTGCPGSLDLRILLYRRVDDAIPIGLDETEDVEETPVVAGEIMGVPACSVTPLVTYTVVNWDAPMGTARVKIAQFSLVDEQIRASGIFPNVDAAWEVEGVDPLLASKPPPALAGTEPISGRVTLLGGEGVAGIGVLVRTRFRIRLNDDDPTNDPDAGFSDPIAFTTSDDTGAFAIDRSAGGYQLEFFSDEFSFRPASVLVETPIEVVQILAEPL